MKGSCLSMCSCICLKTPVALPIHLDYLTKMSSSTTYMNIYQWLFIFQGHFSYRFVLNDVVSTCVIYDMYVIKGLILQRKLITHIYTHVYMYEIHQYSLHLVKMSYTLKIGSFHLYLSFPLICTTLFSFVLLFEILCSITQFKLS